MLKRFNLQIEGIVQGVGFRPFVFSLAKKLNLSGWVLNNSRGVEIEIEGAEHNAQEFIASLQASAPPLSRIQSVHIQEIPVTGEASFMILESKELPDRLPLISPDTDVCEDCIRELFDPADRRYRYPFINCTNCGPRFTIIKDIPYDRDRTTMRSFTMCPECEQDCNNPSDRRFHAQPLGCWQCGPRLEHYLGVVEARVRSGQTGASWQLQRLAQVGGDVHRMMDDYLDNQRAGSPVHEWSL